MSPSRTRKRTYSKRVVFPSPPLLLPPPIPSRKPPAPAAPPPSLGFLPRPTSKLAPASSPDPAPPPLRRPRHRPSAAAHAHPHRPPAAARSHPRRPPGAPSTSAHVESLHRSRECPAPHTLAHGIPHDVAATSLSGRSPMGTPRGVNQAKVLELLGVGSPRERLEVCSLLSESPRTGEASSRRTACDSGLGNHESASLLPRPDDASSSSQYQMITADASNMALHKVCMQSPSAKTQSVQELVVSHIGPRLLKFYCLADLCLSMNDMSLSRKPLLSERSEKKGSNATERSSKVMDRTNFPLPSPTLEKHLLPSPQAKNVSLVAHPLPQPPFLRLPQYEPSAPQVNDAEETKASFFLSTTDARSKDAVPLLSSPKKAKRMQISRSESSNQSVGMSCKVNSASSSPRGSPRPSNLFRNRHSLGGLPNSPAAASASKPQCLPCVGSVSDLPAQFPESKPSWSCGAATLSTQGQAAASKLQCLPCGRQGLDSPSRFSESKPLRAANGGPTLISLTPPPESRFLFPPVGGLSSPTTCLTPKPLCPRKWQKGAILGQGTFGIVHEGLNLEDGSFFAIKVSSVQDVSLEIQQEVSLLSKLEHPNIVRYLGSSIENGCLCIFLELVRMGSLETILRKYKGFEERTIRTYTRQILLGLEYLHSQKTIHRDIKCANILVDVNGQVKLSDFGVAKQIGEVLAQSTKGTPLFMAPEVLKAGPSCYSFSADIWSLGCTVLEMADGKPPWSDLGGFGFYFKVSDGELPPMPRKLSLEGKDFVCKCMQFCAKDRPTASELLQHPFVNCLSSSELAVPWVPSEQILLCPSPL